MPRPVVHFTAERGWINDPLSPLWDGERYHLWFQYVPGSTTWRADCHWGHAVSTDLLHWHEQPVAIAPGDGDDGVWSGSVLGQDGARHAFYTSIDTAAPDLGRVRAARCPDLAGGAWTKAAWALSPPEPDGDTRVRAFRDPYVFADPGGAGFAMLVGAGLERDGERHGAALAYSSPDLRHWTYRGVAASRSASEVDPVATGSIWECPQLVRVEGRWVLLVSVWHGGELLHVAGALVEREGQRLAPARWQRLTAGAGYYAATSFRDADDQPAVIFWIRGLLESGAAGALSVPHRLHLDGERIVLRLHPAVTAAATAPTSARGGSDAALLLPHDLDRVPVTARAGADGPLALRVARAAQGGVEVRTGEHALHLDAPTDGVRILLDGPVVEVSTLGESAALVVSHPPPWGGISGARTGWIRQPSPSGKY